MNHFRVVPDVEVRAELGAARVDRRLLRHVGGAKAPKYLEEDALLFGYEGMSRVIKKENNPRSARSRPPTLTAVWQAAPALEGRFE